ncbi:hypothetical protein RRG08_027333 [Elysia crispata]|uniref:Cadherin domain-containing protein n=1 Tax=Elysia crispata TaxID=231223 RepID=A0AAE0ZN95_9GAST|nr:hypothetical protein RRG08_027333 [Elysia crispata]
MFYRTYCCVLLFLVVFPNPSLQQIGIGGAEYFEVDEDTKIGDKIGKFIVTGATSPKIESLTNYVTVGKPTPSSGKFVVDVYLNIELDADRGRKKVQLLFKASESQQDQEGQVFSEKSIGLVVKDVNDETPDFRDRPYSVTVKEDEKINKVIYEIEAYDPDTAEELTYTLSTDKESPFSLNQEGKLSVVAELDFETQSFYQYTVTVTDKVNHTATAEVFIRIEDVQDSPPEFYRDSYSFTISENSPKGTPLHPGVQAIDGDRGVPNNILLSIFNETCPHLLSIDATSGTLTVEEPPERDAGVILDNDGLCVLFIQASEVGSSQMSNAPNTSLTSVIVRVTDQNDNKPNFSHPIYKASIDEDAQAGVPIAMSGAPVAIKDLDQGNNAKFTVKITSPLEVFEVSPSFAQGSRDILIKVLNSTAIDFEVVQFIIIELEAKDVGNGDTSSAQVHLTINNVNDHGPVFVFKNYDASVPERSALGAEVIMIHATDDDAEDQIHNFKRVTYSLDGPNTFFKINKSSGEVLVANENLDREKQSLYYLNVVAKDGGGRRASSPLRITISDVNDNDPVIKSWQYQTSLDEESTDLKSLVQVEASDEDEPNTNNSAITYSLISTSPDLLLDYFSIDPENGILSVLKPLLYEDINFSKTQQGSVILTVMASDKGDIPRNSTVQVVITLEDKNNQSPQCDLNFTDVAISENLSKHKVTKITATDKDGTAPNNRIMFTLDQASGDLFTIDSNSGWIKTWAGLDFEKEKSHLIEVTVTDLGSPPNSNTCQVEVQVVDVNDVPPKFDNNFMEFEIDENEKFSCDCFAKDDDENDDLKYEIMWSKSRSQNALGETMDLHQSIIDLINLDKNNCTLTVDPLDREKISMLRLQIRVEDKNGQENIPQFDTATISILVKDVNDNKPNFTDGTFYTTTIKENLPDGSLISLNDGLILKVEDQDADDIYSKFEIKLLTHNTTFGIEPPGGTASQSFNIIVINSTDIDFESRTKIIIDLEVMEVGTQDSFRSGASVEVSILNENDNYPSFNKSSYEVEIPEGSPMDYSVIQIQALDKDDPINASSVTYSFDRQNSFFNIHKNTGLVTVAYINLDRETQAVFYITVIAQDGGGRKESCALTIRLTDKNDNYPEFSSSQYETSVEEDSIKMRDHVQVEASDKDEGKNAEIVYSLSSTSPENLLDYFSIDQNNGTVTMLKPIFYEDTIFPSTQHGTIILTVCASDQGEVPLNRSVSVIVRLEDINNRSPRCDSAVYNVTVKENLENFQIIVVNATDEDEIAPNNRFLFSVDQSSEDLFAIDSNSGKISTRAGLDFEQSNSHTISVIVTDLGSPTKSSACALVVTVLDVNDVPPAFDNERMMINLKEGQKLSYPCPATDKDSNYKLAFNIDWNLSKIYSASGLAIHEMSSIQKSVTVDEKNCTVYVDPLDREAFSQLDLVLQVKDILAEENRPQENIANLIITIMDENDQKPVFTNGPNYTASIRENIPVGTLIKFDGIAGIVVKDKDVDEAHSKFEVKLLTHNATFKVEPSQGTFTQVFSIAVLDSSKLDFEKNESFNLLLKVSEINTEQSFSNYATVELSIENENDNFPSFGKPSYEVYIEEESPQNTTIKKIEAQDGDKGNYGQLKYSFKEDSKMFTIDESTGLVSFASGRLDFESGQTTYSLALLATDGGNFTTSCQLVISLIDINDNVPEFSTSVQKKINIDENMQYFYPGLVFKAKDKDSPNSNNSKIVYSFEAADMILLDHLVINEQTGEITISKPFDFENFKGEDKGEFQFAVVATDMGTLPKFTKINVSLIVGDVNDQSPEFTNTSYSLSIPEDTKNGSFLLQVLATDKDVSAKYSEITYSLDSASLATFNIDPKSGSLRTIRGLDREATDSYNVIVYAQDNGTPPKMNMTTVTIIITDVNDTPPQFSWETRTIYKAEGWKTQLAINLAEDKDLNHTLHYFIVWDDSSGVNGAGSYMKGTELKPFIKIDENTGAVSPSEPLDREKIQQFQLTLAVVDKLSASLDVQNDTAVLKIVVEDVNDEKPEFEGPEFIEAKVKETAQVGTALTFVNFSVLIFNDADGEGNNVYSLAVEGNDFSILPTEGRGKTRCSIYVKNTEVLDFEKNENLTLVVMAAENVEHMSNITITLLIENENDNIPTFDSTSYKANLSENAQKGEFIILTKATDMDKGIFGELKYFIDGEQSRFGINSSTGEITLKNANDLDFETTQSYSITVGVKDGGGAVATTRLTISVTDVNDMYPQFEGLPYELEIKEESSIPQRALFVKAKDGDEAGTDNSRIAYNISRVISTSVIMDNFHLDETTGELSVKSPLDFESLLSTKGELLVEVVATDFGEPPLSSAANITVRVLDENDETAKFSFDTYTASVLENSPEGQFVKQVTAVDSDGTTPNNEIYYVIGSGGQDKFQMNSSSGELIVGAGADLDREDNDHFTLMVLAIDKGSPPKTGTATVKVTIEDVNDASPVLTKLEYSPLLVKEDAKKGHTVVHLTAQDEDSEPNLEFSLIWKDSEAFNEKGQSVNITLVQDWFIINETTGMLTVSSELDREFVQQIILKAQVNDTASVKEKVPQIDSVALDILIEDVNDNKPTISSCDNGIQLHVSEATQTGTEITTFSATDKDKDQTISFSINYKSSFSISPSGKLSLSQALDRESKSFENFTVVASDSGSPTKTSECDVEVIVEDANDNDPEFTTNKTNFTVSEYSKEGTVVGQVSAVDKDEGGRGRVTFDFMESKGTFAIDNNGIITVIGELDRESVSLYSLTIIASDNPENPILERKRAATKLIQIHIGDENDQSPIFDIGNRHSFAGVLSEKRKKNDTVSIEPKQISASDADIGKNAEIVYTFKDSNNSYFRIDPNTGQVSVNQENLNGLSGEYLYTVIATDQGEPALNATANLTIVVLDENINSPTFLKSGPISSIPECVIPGSYVYSFLATDDDKEKTTNGKVIYSLDNETSTEDWKFFSIDRNSGVLTTTELLDRETQSKFQIQVKAQDQGEPPFTTLSGLLTIDVSDINDNPPDFNHLLPEQTHFSVLEGSKSVGKTVGKVKAQDQDSNGTLSYAFQEGEWTDYFTLKPDNDSSGIIELKKPLDRETVESISLKVIAIDSFSLNADVVCRNITPTSDDTSVQSNPLTVYVTVEDVDDNPPVFSVKSLNKGFLSSTDFGSEIVSLPIYVDDDDLKKNSFHNFYQEGELMPNDEILKGWSREKKADPIRVDVNGSVITNFKFPENVFGQFSLKVKANDSAGYDIIDLNIYVVGSSQVVYLTFYLSENDLMLQQLPITELLSSALPYNIVPDNILPFNNKDGSVDGSKSILAVHAVEKNSNKVILGETLLNRMDTSSTVNKMLQGYKILSTETASQARDNAVEDDGRIQYILAAIITLMAMAFLITLFLLLNNIQRFKRKLKAATLEVHAFSGVEQDQFPGLDNKFKSSNPIFNRDDISLDDLGDNNSLHSGSSGESANSLDQNEVLESEENGPASPQVEAEEQEMTLDLYDRGQFTGHQEQQHINNYRNMRHSSDADVPQVARRSAVASLQNPVKQDISAVLNYLQPKASSSATPV